MNFDVSEAKKYARRLESMNVPRQMDEIVKSTGEFFIDTVSDNTPVDTGLLKKMWLKDNPKLKVKRQGNVRSVTIKNTTPYASFVEKGHKKVLWGVPTNGWVMGRFFQKKSEFTTEKQLEKAINNYIEDVFK